MRSTVHGGALLAKEPPEVPKVARRHGMGR